MGNGTVSVTATAGSASGSAAVTVDQIPADVAVAPDSLAPGAIGDTGRVDATFVDANRRAFVEPGPSGRARDRSVPTVHASGLIATMDSVGLVTAKGAGATPVGRDGGLGNGQRSRDGDAVHGLGGGVAVTSPLIDRSDG